MLRVAIAVLVLAVTAMGQPDTVDLAERYRFVNIVLTIDSRGELVRSRTLGGEMLLNDGTAIIRGRLADGLAAPAPYSNNVSYEVRAGGFMTLGHPLISGLTINARIGKDGSMILGSTTEAGGSDYDFFIAIPGTTPAGISNSLLNGTYSGAVFAGSDGQTSGLRSAFVDLESAGNGTFSSISLGGHAVADGDRFVTETVQGATYNLAANATGTASFGSTATLLSGGYEIYITPGGKQLIGFSTDNGGHSILVATKSLDGEADNSKLSGNYWIAELLIDATSRRWSSAVGSFRADGAGDVTLGERIKDSGVNFDFTGVNEYFLESDGRGFLGPVFTPGITNFTVGAGDTSVAVSCVGAQVQDFGLHGLFVGIELPGASGDGLYFSPLGVLNAGSFAPPTFPAAGGAIMALFGSNLADDTLQAQALPLPTQLGDTQVVVNDIPVPLFFVSPGQINFQMPFGLTGNESSIAVRRGGDSTPDAAIPLAATSPAIFSQDSNGKGRGVVTHADGSVISPSSPAAPNEIVVLYLTGMGELSPALQAGDGPPIDPLSLTTDPAISVFVGDQPGDIEFSGAAPGLAGVYQINLRIPALAPIGDAIPLAIATSTAFSDLVTIALRP